MCVFTCVIALELALISLCCSVVEANAREEEEMARAQEEAERRIPPPPSLAGLPPPMEYDEVLFGDLDDLEDEMESIVIDTGMATVKVQCVTNTSVR